MPRFICASRKSHEMHAREHHQVRTHLPLRRVQTSFKAKRDSSVCNGASYFLINCLDGRPEAALRRHHSVACGVIKQDSQITILRLMRNGEGRVVCLYGMGIQF